MQNPPIDRRTFVKSVSAAGIGIALADTLASAQAAPQSPASVSPPAPQAGRRRYALVGTGGRSGMFRRAILNDFKASAELVALSDKNPGRLKLAVDEAVAAGAKTAGYAHTDFDKMIQETRPQTVIVTTVDGTHHEYIVRALELGCDVITEKPMTTTAEKCQQIIDAQKRTGKSVRVTFNYRYSPPRTQVKDILMSGEIGDIVSLDFHWLLNTTHGADYFRRWHSNKINSGGLMIHKASHHFDLVNWWLGAVPVAVTATGKREFYTPSMAKRLGLASHHERCRTCPEKDKCTFYLDLAAGGNKSLYLDQEHHDGYFRDKCVFRPDIDIEDNMNVIVQYDNGVNLSYSLNAFNAWEGYQIAFNGTKGRLEHSIVEDGNVFADNTVVGAAVAGGISTRVIPMRGPARIIEPWSGEGAHGGGDAVMLNDIFGVNPPADKYKRASDHRSGAAAILVGIAANKCFTTGASVKIADLVTGMTAPEYAPMPSKQEAVPMPRASRGRGPAPAPATAPR
jgi:predicted dehydrogenase